MSELASIWRDGGFHADTWVRPQLDGGLATQGKPLLVPLSGFLAEPERWLGQGVLLAVEIAAGEAVDRLEPYLNRLTMIAVAFPKFSDGRGYSTARLLRERYAFKGELRATGDVLSDQIPLMRRCGFDSFEIDHGPTRAALLAGRLAEVRHYYQPIPNATEVPAGTRPWLRQPA